MTKKQMTAFHQDGARRHEGLTAALRCRAEVTGGRPDHHAAAVDDTEVFLEVVGDLLADILHVGGALGVTPEELFDQALFHYDSERIVSALEEDGLNPDPTMAAPIRRRVALIAPSADAARLFAS